MATAHLPRVNPRWRDPKREAVDRSHLTDAHWRAERKYCIPRVINHATACRQARAIMSRIYCHHPTLAGSHMAAPPTARHGQRLHHLPATQGPLLFRTARNSRKSRQTRLQRRGLSPTTPAWLYTLREGMREALRLTTSSPGRRRARTPSLLKLDHDAISSHTHQSPRRGAPTWNLP
jgi:hypothetical protein